ncbi:hypothetical protein K523DRAFT_100936 [Schizophyllum commune Tattone D]|nr:hypothetical protein K523DRAFT_100936 [Schizophyllum commune Tattone D]
MIEMALDPQPPPSASAPSRPTPATLYQLILDVPQPKTKTAKTCQIPIATWNLIRSLATALGQQPASPDNDAITSLTNKIDALSARIETSLTNSPPKPTYSTVAALPPRAKIASTKGSVAATTDHTPAPRATDADVLLVPIDRRRPPFQTDAPAAIRSQCNTLLRSLSITYPDPTTGAPVHPSVRAVAKLRNGNIRLTAQSAAEARLLDDRSTVWLPSFSTNLHVHFPTYPIVLHRVPTRLNLIYNANSNEEIDMDSDLAKLFLENDAAAPGLIEALSSVHWLSQQSIDQLRATKPYASLVVHLASEEIANACIENQLAWEGTFLRTEKYRSRPIQCYNCFQFGHMAAQCRRPTVCGTCAGPHRAPCPCPNPTPCKDRAKCTHTMKRCCAVRGCGAAHAATSPDCPVKQALFAQVAHAHAATGPYFSSRNSST